MKKMLLIALWLFFFSVLASCGGESQKQSEQDSVQKQGVMEAEQLLPPIVESSFDFVPEKPINGTLKAVVELGASGFNSFIINIDEEKRWELVKPRFGQSSIVEEGATAEDIRSKLKEYIQMLLDDGVLGKNVHFVVSSGAAKEPIVEQIVNILRSEKYYVNMVTPEQEALYAYDATVPKSYRNNAYVVDMGSGNTKIAYMEKGKVITIETYGAKYAKKGVDHETVYNEVYRLVEDIPTVFTRYCFIIGGVPYQLGQFTNGGNTDKQYILLSERAGDYAAFADQEGEKVECGLNIYEAIMKSTKTETVVFDSRSNFSIGFLVNMKYPIQKNASEHRTTKSSNLSKNKKRPEPSKRSKSYHL